MPATLQLFAHSCTWCCRSPRCLDRLTHHILGILLSSILGGELGRETINAATDGRKIAYSY